METTYTIEFMRLAEPHLAPIKHPSAFHVAYYCKLRAPLMKASVMAEIVGSYRFADCSRDIAIDCRGIERPIYASEKRTGKWSDHSQRVKTFFETVANQKARRGLCVKMRSVMS